MTSDLRWGLGFLAISLALAVAVAWGYDDAAPFTLIASGAGVVTGAYILAMNHNQRHGRHRHEGSRRRRR